jgi:hypothetical protein
MKIKRSIKNHSKNFYFKLFKNTVLSRNKLRTFKSNLKVRIFLNVAYMLKRSIGKT